MRLEIWPQKRPVAHINFGNREGVQNSHYKRVAIIEYVAGTTDYMDRFIDEQDPSRDRSSSPNFYSLMFGSGDSSSRKGLSLYPGAKSQLHMGGGDSNGAADISAAISSQPVTSSSPEAAASTVPAASQAVAAAVHLTTATAGAANGMEKNSEPPSQISPPSSTHP